MKLDLVHGRDDIAVSEEPLHEGDRDVGDTDGTELFGVSLEELDHLVPGIEPVDLHCETSRSVSPSSTPNRCTEPLTVLSGVLLPIIGAGQCMSQRSR